MRALYLLCSLLATTTVQAFEIEECELWQLKANNFMTWRQQGTSIAEAVSQTSGNVSRGLLLRAYAEPQENGYEAQYEAIQRFSQTVYDECKSETKHDLN